MSGVSSEQDCPICGSNMDIYSDYNPFESVSGQCLECGFCYYTKVQQTDLEEINDIRKDYELKPIKASQLKKYSKEIKEIW